ncbi:tol-pal system protein YbgF [Achromobacter xylosoxidans]
MRDYVLSLRPLMAATGLVLAALAAPAHAFSDDEARKAILDLRQQVQQQNEQSQRAKLQLADQIQALQQEVAQLRDQLELVSRQQPSANKPGGAAGGANPPGATARHPQDQAAYEGAIDLLRKGQYMEASESLAAFTALYPASQLAPSAQFYLGSSRYALKDFKGAIEQLNAMVQKAPDNARAPDALLVIAGSQIEMNNRAGAKTTLQRIVRDYPTTPAANTAKSRLQLLQ